jgi:hypothetical protein
MGGNQLLHVPRNSAEKGCHTLITRPNHKSGLDQDISAYLYTSGTLIRHEGCVLVMVIKIRLTGRCFQFRWRNIDTRLS